MPIVINVDGRIGGERDGVVSVLDHGFLYGEGVYEVVRTYNRTPFLFDRHLQRMRRSAEMIRLPVPFTDAEIEQRMRQTTDVFYAQADREADDVYVRILLTRGVGEISYDPAACRAPTLVVIVKPHIGLSAEVYERGVKVALVPVIRNHPGSINPLIKSNNLLNNALAAQEALRRNAFEGIMHNYRGEISEGSISNLFVVMNGSLITPPIDAGLLAGITRGYVIELATGAGVTIRESVLHDEDLFGANEAFVTSSTQEIVPVVQIDEQSIGTGRPGPVTRTLLERYRQKVAEMTGAKLVDGR
jgi:branched-chain amino acid aminotransferase